MTQAGNAELEAFLDELHGRVSELEIVTGDTCAARYRDRFAVTPAPTQVRAAIQPTSVSAVQEVVRIANRLGVLLWPTSRGENLGYGGAAPAGGACVILDLSRMNRILEVNAADAFCLVEPGVSFADLFARIERDALPLWLSVPGYGEGSVAANALERGVGATPYGDHAAQICGLEVVLGDGELVRTGMGALPGSGMWQRQKAGLGPRFDEIFLQSGYGVVTKLGLWLMPAPEASAAVEIEMESRDGLSALVEALGGLARTGVVQGPPVVANWLTSAALRSTRAQWTPAGGPLSVETEQRILRNLGLGWWNAKVRLYGLPEIVDLGLDRAESVLRALPGCSLRTSRWQRGEPASQAHRGIPTAEGLANREWCGRSGAHVDFSVALPISGAEALRHALQVKDALAEAGLDYHSAFYLRERHMLNVVQILFDQADEAMCRRVDAVYRELITAVARRGLGLYRVPFRFQSEAIAQFSFGDDAISSLGARIKRALDPKAILSPGKHGHY